MVPSLLPPSKKTGKSSLVLPLLWSDETRTLLLKTQQKDSLLSISIIDGILDLGNFAKQSLSLHILMSPHYHPHCVVSRTVFVYVPHCTYPESVAQHIKMYLTKVLLKMGQGPYVFIISQQCATMYLPQGKGLTS